MHYSVAASAFAPWSSCSRRLGPSLNRPSKTTHEHAPIIATHRRASKTNDPGGDDSPSCWNPDLRKQIGAISAIGLLETAYLTYDKLQYSANGKTASLIGAICSSTENGASSSCKDVLHGPYASLHLGTLDVPLSALGMAAYGTVFALATLPLLTGADDNKNGAVLDGVNRVALLGGTTLMASFSIYLMSILVGVLQASCLFCFVSAGLSITMAGLSWFGGMLPSMEEAQNLTETSDRGGESQVMDLRKKGVIAGASSVGVATMMALGLFLGVTYETGNVNSLTATSATSSTGTLLASTSAGSNSYRDNVPPPITTKSSANALTLASDMKALDSRMFGAFWCSHCYDQKQAFGYEAMQYLPYIECDREGYNNKRDMCRAKEVPGYPTWEIGGELFPGERSLEELREIVDDIRSGK